MTGYNDYAIKAFERYGIEYLTKPITKDRLLSAMQRMAKNKDEEVAVQNIQPLKIHLLNQLKIFYNESDVIALEWRTIEAEQLFLYLLQHRGQIIHIEDLVDFLWPDLEMKKVYVPLYAALYHVRKILAPLSNHIQIRKLQEGYMMTLHEVVLDADGA